MAALGSGRASLVQQLPDQVSSRPVACLHCRQRRSYCSKEKPSCSRCRDGGLKCVYEGSRKILVNESYLRELEAKARALEALPQPIQVRGRCESGTRGTSGDGGSGGDDDDDFGDEQPLLEPFTQLSLDRPSSTFQGPGSSDNFLRNVRKLSGLEGGEARTKMYQDEALPSRRQGLALGGQWRLPPIDIARRLFAAQYMYIGRILAFTDPKEAFEQQLQRAYAQGGMPSASDGEACLEYAKVLLVLAFGQLYSVNQWVDFRGPPGFEYFCEALQLLPETHEHGSVVCVETLALAGYFLQNMNRRDAALQYTGRALRMAMSLGLHHEVAQGHLDGREREQRRRVWWSVYSLDRILCVKSGNPLTVRDEDVGVDMPAADDDDDDEVLRQYTQLSRILGQMHAAIYSHHRRQSGKSLVASVQAILQALARWHAQLPEGLRFERRRHHHHHHHHHQQQQQQQQQQQRLSRESVGTMAHYYQCINMTVRPLLFHVVKKRLEAVRARGAAERERDWREGLSATTVSVVDMCIGAAHDTIDMMTLAAQRDMVATYGYMDGEHIFSATIVLVMVCAAFPTRDAHSASMEAGLSLLRTMGERGNSQMGARYELLASLQASGLSPWPMTAAAPTGTAEAPTTATATSSTSDLAPSTTPSSSHSSADDDAVRLFDESLSAGMDFGLWEEGFAYPMDVDFDFGRASATSVGLSDLIYSPGNT
ncbi:hypothetical protein CDD81_2049 [Ophiocordyceps australis]|uniref:Zn(2)-C6 fungal-type domain-containing protein n=1 Tax=Ophiocordyceps australis TaxID=1399860 RepID=A0A2C5YF63_9HYPO|nr:hypothetical protein CDD81_2049 [Ophiocordyceps australis]